MLARKIVHTLCGVALLGVLATSSTGAFENASRTTYFTFSGTVQMPGVALAAGTYIFEVVNPNGGSDVVRVISRDRKKTYLMRLTRPVRAPVGRQSRRLHYPRRNRCRCPSQGESVVSAKRDPRPRVHLLTHPHPRRAGGHASGTTGQPLKSEI